MSEERDRLEQAKAKMNELTLGREYDAAWRAVLSALEAAKAQVKELEAEKERHAQQLMAAVRLKKRAEAEVAALRAEVERLKEEAKRYFSLLGEQRDESRARAARLEMALRGQATRLLPDGGVCYCDIQRSDECRNEPPCVEARAALASGESREGAWMAPLEATGRVLGVYVIDEPLHNGETK